MTRIALASQTLIVIQSAETTFTKEGSHIPPLGTKIAAGTITSETSSGAAATPAAARWEIITGKPRITINTDNDNQEFPDIGTRRVEHELGNYKIDGTLEMYVPKAEERYRGAVMGLWDATNLKYSDATFYSKYNIWVLTYPDAMTLSATTCDTCRKLFNVTFNKEATTHESGKGIMLSMPFTAEYDERHLNYTLPTLNLLANTLISATPFTLTTQPSYPTTLTLTITDAGITWGGTEVMTITGTDADGDTISEALNGFTAANLTETTTIPFNTVAAAGIVATNWTTGAGDFVKVDAVGGFGT